LVRLKRLGPGTAPRNAALAAGLDHPNVAHVYTAVEHGGHAYLAGEYVEGASLRRVVQHSGALRPEQALEATRGALEGLVHAHGRGLAHGSMKAENVIVDRQGASKLVDFGQHGAADTRGDVVATAGLLDELFGGHPPGVIADAIRKARTDGPAATAPSAQGFLRALERAAEESYGPDWRSRGSLAGLVLAAVGAGTALGAITAGGAAPAAGTLVQGAATVGGEVVPGATGAAGAAAAGGAGGSAAASGAATGAAAPVAHGLATVAPHVAGAGHVAGLPAQGLAGLREVLTHPLRHPVWQHIRHPLTQPFWRVIWHGLPAEGIAGMIVVIFVAVPPALAHRQGGVTLRLGTQSPPAAAVASRPAPTPAVGAPTPLPVPSATPAPAPSPTPTPPPDAGAAAPGAGGAGASGSPAGPAPGAVAQAPSGRTGAGAPAAAPPPPAPAPPPAPPPTPAPTPAPTPPPATRQPLLSLTVSVPPLLNLSVQLG
jgi:serine/threonine-protein kinase